MLHVNLSMRPRRRPTKGPDEVVELILGELDPIMARTRDAMARVWHDHSVSKANLHVLMLMEQFGQLPMSKLATMLDVSLPNMTGIIDRMEENGLVERLRNDEDRRVVLVRATARGAELGAEMPRLRREYMRQVVNSLSEGDRRNCYEAFRAFREAADKLAVELAASGNATHQETPGVPAGPGRRHRSARPADDRGTAEE